MNNSLQQTRDSIGSNPNIIGTPLISSEPIVLWEEPDVIYDRDINNSWIVGSSTNAIVGTWTGTAGGGQLVVGDTTNTEVLLRIVPPNDVYINFLRDTPTNQTAYCLDSTGTATVNTSTNRIDWTAGQSVIFRLSQSNDTYQQVMLLLDNDSERTDMDFDTEATFQISVDGKSSWTTLTNNTKTILGTSGSAVYFKWVCSAARYWKCANSSGYEKPIMVRLYT